MVRDRRIQAIAFLLVVVLAGFFCLSAWAPATDAEKGKVDTSTGVTAASEKDDTSGVQEQEQPPAKIAKKHFPWFWLVAGAVVVGVGIYFLVKGLNKKGDCVLKGSVRETFSGRRLAGIKVTALGVDGAHEVLTDSQGFYSISLVHGKYDLYFNLSTKKMVVDAKYVAAKLEGVSVGGTKRLELDLVESTTLFPDMSLSLKLIWIYRGESNNGRNWRWDHSPARFVASLPPGTDLNWENLREAYDWIEMYTDGFIKTPKSVNEIEVRYDADESRSVFSQIDDAVIYWARDRIGASETSGRGYSLSQSLFYAPMDDPINIRGQAVDSLQWAPNFRTDLESIFNGREITPLDLRWGKFNYRFRKPGESIFIEGGGICEIRLL